MSLFKLQNTVFSADIRFFLKFSLIFNRTSDIMMLHLTGNRTACCSALVFKETFVFAFCFLHGKQKGGVGTEKSRGQIYFPGLVF